jgi:ATP-dependent Lon protease
MENNTIFDIMNKKIDFYKNVIQNTILHVQKNKMLDILGITDINNCVNKLIEIDKKIKDIVENKNIDTTISVSNLQKINNELSGVMKNYGTHNLDDLLTICFGNNNKITNSENEILKYELLQKYFHPISYKLTQYKNTGDQIDDKTQNLDCFEVANNYKQFYMKVYGIKLYIYNSNLNKSIIVNGFVDDIVIDLINNKYIINIQSEIKENVPKEDDFTLNMFNVFMSSLTIKDYLIHKNYKDYYGKYVGCIHQINLLKQKQISSIIKEFINDNMYSKRTILINLLIGSTNYENQYLAYLLYDILSNDSNGTIDTQEQTNLFDSFPWAIQEYFKNAMKKTIQYTNDLSNFDLNKIPIEQQICLLKAPDSVKEKAMIKLKELKSKSEDSGSKVRQYLDGLLKIPFNIYKKEPILYIMEQIKTNFKNIYKKYEIEKQYPEIPNREKYTNIEIMQYLKVLKNNFSNQNVYENLIIGDKKQLCNNIILINKLLKKHISNEQIINYSKMNKTQMKNEIEKYISICKNINDAELFETSDIFDDIKNIEEKINTITSYINSVKSILDNVVYGHNNAKKQIEKIIGQWINSSGNTNGYVLGFEGSPGVGKTTLAKGLSECLKDENGESRPFSLIAIGGDSYSSSLVGHSYTYVGSTWGQIVQILMDKKCMNPIILIDEVDKISKTEQGKEIIGILTHLLDYTQNNSFQDKYFSGIELDLSKVLFILSYNDAELIDKILLDRVHRIKFNNLSIEDKIVIANKHILPEIYRNMGLDNMINISDEVLKFIIDEYTLESGVRKLKEKLFEIVGEINLNILKTINNHFELPINITITDIKNNYFKHMREIKIQQIHNENKVGVINCLWANAYSVGGILSASAKFIPSDCFLKFKITGLIDQMMDESFQISLTLAYNLLSEERKQELNELYNGKNKYGIHLHMGDGSINKSGTSAGVAITILLYSLLNNVKIKNDFAITGEACDLNGKVGEIGALDTKIIYGIKSGVKNFIYPLENKQDFDKFTEKYKNSLDNIHFYPITEVHEAINLIIDTK